jgi:hypothetical protein
MACHEQATVKGDSALYLCGAIPDDDCGNSDRKEVGLAKNSVHWRLGILEAPRVRRSRPMIPRENGNINIRVYCVIQWVPAARVGGRRTARISVL